MPLEAAVAFACFLPSSSFCMIPHVLLLALAMILLYLVKTLRPWRIRRKKSSSSSTCTPPPLPPGPAPWPVVGNLPEMLASGKPAFRWIHDIMKEMGTDIACIKLGGVHVVPVACPKIALEVLRNQDATFASRPLTFASRTFSRGYRDAAMCPHGDHWKKMRRVLAAEVLSPSRLRWLHDKRAAEADNLTRYVYSLATARSGESGAVDVRHVARHYCGNVVRRLVFNTRYFGEPERDGGPGALEVEHVDAVFAALGLLYSFSVSDYLPWLRLGLDGHEKMVREANERVSRLHDTVVDERWRKWKKKNGGEESSPPQQQEQPEDLLDVLITLKDDATGEPVLSSIEEVKALVMDMALASMDNPSNAVEWALGEMVAASSPETMRKAVAEIDGVVGRERLVQESDVPRLGYLKACIREAFRLHPVAPFNVPHVALADAAVAGHRIPEGSHVVLSRTGLGRNPRVWDDPLRFRPERHINSQGTGEVMEEEVSLAEHDLRFISFSTGRRGCVAAALGTAMSVMLFGRLLQGFSWSKMPGVPAIDLSESRHSTFMARPLVLQAKPRLAAHLYILGSRCN